MAERFGEWHKEPDGWWIRYEKTTRPFRKCREEAAIGLTAGLMGLVCWPADWKGNQLIVKSLGADGVVDYEPGKLTCRLKIHNMLGFMEEKILADVGTLTMRVAGSPMSGEKDVFIVHGHNLAARTELRDICKGLGLNPIVLVEQDDLGLTIIEKFEYYARTCSFAFVLMTPDDATATKTEQAVTKRARQNVIMELGWFMAYLGRDRVAILHQGELEIPSDILGVITLRFKDQIGELAAKIATRLRLAGVLDG